MLLTCATFAAPSMAVGETESKILKAAQLRNDAINESLAGNFNKGLTEIRESLTLNPDDPIAMEARKLLDTYDEQAKQIKKDRQSEYEYEVQRVMWALQVQKYFDSMAAAQKKLVDGLRKIINNPRVDDSDLVDFYHEVGIASSFEDASAEEAAQMKKTSVEALDKSLKKIDEAISLVKDEKTPYARLFLENAQKVRSMLLRFREVWRAADPSTPQSRWNAARDIFELEYDNRNDLNSLGIFLSYSPWKLALIYADSAKEMAPVDVDVSKQEWFRLAVAEGRRQGDKAISEHLWRTALIAYSTLDDLLPADKDVTDTLEKVRTHYRMGLIYGQKTKEETPDVSESLDPDEVGDADEEADEDITWKEMISRVDARMVRTAITRLRKSYVKAIDFRELTRGALESVLILAETPQVVQTFPGLKDEKKRNAFIEALKKELEDINHPDRVDHVRLQMVLNRVLACNEETGVNIPAEVLVMEFTNGFLSKLDKFSSMIWPYEVENFTKSTMGHFTGIGVQIKKDKGEPLRVVTPLLDTPAHKAGIKAGDIILKVDGVDTKKQSTDKLIKRIMGEPGTKVVLTIKRRGVAEPFDVPVVRQAVHIATIKGWQRYSDGKWDFLLNREKGIGYIRITQFTEKTADALHEALAELHKQGISSLVLDLRGNPGGLLQSAAEVADEFLSEGKIVYTRGLLVPRTDIDAYKPGLFENGNLVVIVDQGSASASEILSGALKDHARAKIIGQRSYGKGSVQNIITVYPNTAFLKLTTAYYYLPSGRLLHRTPESKDWGVNPDVSVFMTPRQTLDWMKLRYRTDLLQDVLPQFMAEDLKMQYNADIQLNTAVLMLKLMQLKDKAANDYTRLAGKVKAGES